MRTTTRPTYEAFVEKPLSVFEIFKDFFGEENVDIQDLPSKANYNAFPDECLGRRINIYVHWPLVEISNEHDDRELITHLYAKLGIDYTGRLAERFSLNRSEYTVKHMISDYMHSHIPGINSGSFTQFLSPCTGSGPINRTMLSLDRDGYNADLWQLFCLELDKFVHTESLEGGPYRRISNISMTRRNGRASSTHRDIILREKLPDSISIPTVPLIAEFTVYLLSRKVLKFNFDSNRVSLAMSPETFYTTISNEFISWCNKKFLVGQETGRMLRSYLQTVTLKEGLFYKISNNSNIDDLVTCEGQRVLLFKGQQVYLHISDLDTYQSSEENHTVLLLRSDLACYILTKILDIINYNYGNDKDSINRRTYFI